MGIALPLSSPLYEGGAVSDEVPRRWPVALGGRGFVLELRPVDRSPGYERSTLPMRREPIDQGRLPGEQSLTTRGAWRRSMESWHHGAGQEFRDGVNDEGQAFDPSRFDASIGVDVWTEGQMSLLPDTELKSGVGTGGGKILAVGEYLYAIDGTGVKFTTNADVAAPTWTPVTGLAGTTVVDITTDDHFVYIADGTNVKKVVAGAAPASAFSAVVADRVQYANGRLLAVDDEDLVELDAAGAATILKTLTNTALRWGGIASSPFGIYAWSQSSAGEGFSTVWVLTVSETTGALQAARYAMQTPNGERLNAMVFYGGRMLLGTSRGVRLASIDSGRGLTFGPVLEVGSAVYDFASEGEYVWATLGLATASLSGTVRLNLAEETAELVPAWATDVLYATTVTPLWVERLEGRTYFTVAGTGIVGSTANKVATGWLSSGKIRFGTHERKIPNSIELRHAPLAGTVTMSVVDEDGVTTSAGVSSEADSIQPNGDLSLTGVDGESCSVVATLTRDAVTTDGPVIYRTTLRALVAPRRQDVFVLPIKLFPKVKWRNMEHRYDPAEAFSFLKSLEREGAPVRYQEGHESYDVLVEEVRWLPTDWLDRDEFMQGHAVVTVITIEET